jgi:isocitrate lyase
MEELAQKAVLPGRPGRRVAASVVVPVIADGDTGYGNELNATRTVRDGAASPACISKTTVAGPQERL